MSNDYSEQRSRRSCRITLTRAPHEKRMPFSTEIPNEETRQALEAVERREGLCHAKDADELFRQLGI